MYDSPLDPDYPAAAYRVMCPVCGLNLWADVSPPPVQGEEIIAQHSCPGRDTQLDVTPDMPAMAPGPELEPKRRTSAKKAPASAPVGAVDPARRDDPTPPPKPRRSPRATPKD